MNYKTLTQGSIVNFEDELWRVDVISHTNKKLTLHNLNGDTANQPFYMINPVPITPELLECLGLKEATSTIWHIGVGSVRCFYSQFIEVYFTKDGLCGIELRKGAYDLTIKYTELHLHDLQHFLRGIDGLDFEITLDKLKGF